MALADDLCRSPWFAHQPARLRDALVASGRVLTFVPGQSIYDEGDPETGLLAVISGALRLEATVGSDATVLLQIVQPPAVLGQSHRRGGGPRIVSIRASTPARVWMISDHALERIGQDDPALWLAMTELLYGQLDASIHLAAQILALPPRARIIARLRALQVDGVVALSQADLAELCGLSRKTVNQHLAALEGMGAIRRDYAAIRVLAIDRLGG